MSDFQTKYGVIHDGGPCKDDYENINLYTYQGKQDGVVKLQGPALRSLKAAELRITSRRQRDKDLVNHILITGIGWRDCDLQRELWQSDPNRYANPDGSKHCRGLAIDVDQNQGIIKRRKIHKALLAEDWHQSVPGEPWHYSYHVVG